MPIFSKHQQWSSKWIFVLAIIGIAIGLGNVWGLPFVISENGGGAFVYAYIVCMLLIITPILMVEIIIGKNAQANPLSAISNLVQQQKASRFWNVIGGLAVLAGLIVLSYLSVSGGWSIFYITKVISNGFAEVPAEMIKGEFDVLLSSPRQLIIWHTVFMLCAIGIVVRGIKQGVEMAVGVLVPIILILLLIMFAYCYNALELTGAVDFMFKFELSKLTFAVVLNASVYALLTSGLAVGAIMMYSAYLPKNTTVSSVSFAIILVNILAVLLVSFMVCVLAFNYDAELTTAPTLIYQTLLVVFTEMPKGMLFASCFFVLLFMAALIAAVALLEPAVAYLSERIGLGRKHAVWGVGSVVWLLGIVIALSLNVWAFEFEFLAMEKSKGIADMFSIASKNVVLPLGAALMVMLASRRVTKGFFREQLAFPSKWLFKVWRFLTRFICFVVLTIVFLYLMFGALFTYDECMVTFQLSDLTIRFELCNH